MDPTINFVTTSCSGTLHSDTAHARIPPGSGRATAGAALRATRHVVFTCPLQWPCLLRSLDRIAVGAGCLLRRSGDRPPGYS